MSFLDNFFSKTNKYDKVITKINSLEPEISKLSNDELKSSSLELRENITLKNFSLEDALPKAFTLVRESAKRNLNQRHYDVQLLGGIALFNGHITQMATGEGKTLSATCPAYLHALSGKSSHIITVNDYLAQRDAVWMGQVYYSLGLSTSCIIHDSAYIYDPTYIKGENKEDVENPDQESSALLDKERDTTGSFRVQKEYLRPISRKEAYQADIVYGTNNEFGFDYLRDNLAYSKSSQVQKDHYFAIIDEVDSILIDEARTPLIISAPDTQAAEYYKIFAKIVSQLENEKDYIINEKDRYVQATEEGIEKVEKILGIDNIYGGQNVKMVHYLEESLKAKGLFSKDRHYVVKDGEIIIVDEFTGRLMYGRRYSGGLHQAIEAKEGIRVQEESKTYAQITIQNYFRLYERISGMTGTAATSSEEFNKVYNLDVVTIPTNKPGNRKDLQDLIYKNKESKYKAIVQEVKKRSELGQPILIGTTSIDENELLSTHFSKAGIRYEVLNAKNHEREAEIIAQAGRKGAVTLATNMAGRGVDIILGGNPQDKLEAEEIKNFGGLFVLGTQRNDARRIDNQLRGRSGRQGDPGQTHFFLSLEGDLMRIFGGEKIQNLMTRFNLPDDVPIESSLVMKIVNEAQKKVEGMNFDVRKHLLEYDDVLNKQRSAIYRRRQNILEKIEIGETKEILTEITLNVLKNSLPIYLGLLAQRGESEEVSSVTEKEAMEKVMELVGLLNKDEKISEEDAQNISEGKSPEILISKIDSALQDPQIGQKMLASLDIFWTNHLENLEALQESVRMRAYGQKDPLVEYKRESYQMFKDLIANAENWVVSNVFQKQEVKTQNFSTPSTPKSEHGDIGRNDPCWCKSGKKYKKCHGR